MSTRIGKEKIMTKPKQLIPLKLPRQSRSRITYDAILEATTQILIEKGYSETTTNHIAERAGISIGSLYQYFPNKEAIAIELLQRHIVSGPAFIDSNAIDSMKNMPNPAQFVKSIIEAACDHHAENPTLHRVLEEEIPHPLHIREALQRNDILYSETIANWITQQGQMRVSNVMVAAQLVHSVIKTMTHWYIIKKQTEIARDVFVNELTEIVMRYLSGSAKTGKVHK